MTPDHPATPGSDEPLDAEIERRLRTAFAGAATPDAPASLHAELARLSASPDVRVRPGARGWPSTVWLVVGLALAATVVGSLLAGGSNPTPTVSAEPSVVASASPTVAGSCPVSPATVHGTWWREIGGPGAFFNWDGDARIAQSEPWKLFVRFDPDAASPEDVSVWAERLQPGARADGTFNSRVDLSTIFRLDAPAPALPGGVYLFEQPLPSPGCWQLTGAIGDAIVGTAVVEVMPDPNPVEAASPSGGPTPAVEPSPGAEAAPEESMAPAADDVLPLAGRDGQGGRLYCSNRPFGFDGLTATPGAEDRFGPEYDVLRSLIGTGLDVSWAPPGGEPSFREAARDPDGVVFLNDRAGPTPIEGGPYAYITLKLGPTGWAFEGSGDCQPQGVPGPDFWQATWTLDPDFAPPDAETRTLHLLVQELACSGGRTASGRISPAFVVESRHEVAIEVFVQGMPGEGDCPASPPTPATLRLPAPLGDRTLLDVGAIGLGGSGG